MAAYGYLALPRVASERPGSPDAEAAIRALLADLAGRKELSVYAPAGPAPQAEHAPAGFGAPGEAVRLFLPGLRLSGAQQFVRGFESPDTEYPRLLVSWQTGTGKSIGAIGLALEFIRSYRARAALGDRPPGVHVISFTARETIQEDLLRYPEFGFVAQAEVEELRRLRAAAAAAGPASPEARQLSGLVGVLRRRITDPARGGYFRFYGYKEFANRLFAVTAKGHAAGFDVQALYGREAPGEKGGFGDRLAGAVRQGHVEVDEQLLDALRGGLLVADEIHNVYNILEKNNYGIAIQYALDALGPDAPRAVYMSATPMTGSAAEAVDLLNLLVPRAVLPGGLPLRRADFFTRTAAPRGYREEPSFAHGGVRYSLACARAAAAAKPVERLAVRDLRWALEPPDGEPLPDTPEDRQRTAAADLAVPVLVAEWHGRPAVVDGAHRLARAIATGAEDLPARRLGAAELALCREGAPEAARLEEAVEEGGAGEAEEAEGPVVVSQLREGALECIAHLAAGRVSFLLDADVGSYPRRLFVGEEVPGVPYLRLTPCPMSPFHARTLAREQGEGAPRGLAPEAYTLYDMAYPNPDFAPDAALVDDPAAYGLYRSGETPARLAQAPEDWRAAAGVAVERAGRAGAATALITGAFLGADRLPHYSTKWARIVAAAVAAVRAGPGKFMVYHHRVRMSGILTGQEALRMNGFADETSAPTDATLCAVCGVARGAHGRAGEARGPPHEYAPARFVVAHSDIDRPTMLRSMARFNAAANLEGYQYRGILGSKVIREGLNFRAVRWQFIASLPTDYPTLVQVFGRVVRKDSHAELPEDQRDVRILVFVSTRADGRPAPELQRYADKGREYLVIQEVERALRGYAVDGFANYLRVRAALHAGPGGELRPSLDGLPYSPVVGPEAVPAAPRTATFEAYGHGEREVALLAAVCRVLFRARPVWTYADLWAAARGGAVRGANYNPALFDEGCFALALASLARPAGEPPAAVARAGRFYVYARAAPDGRPVLDVESYLREAPWRPDAGAAPPAVAVRVGDYLRDTLAGQNFAVRLREYEAAYLRPGAAPIELSLVQLGIAFHYALLRRLVVAGLGGAPVTSDDDRVRALYRRFRVAVTVADASAPAAASAFRGAPAGPEALIGYATPEAVALYDPAAAAWYGAPHAAFGIGRRYRENDILVGFVVSPGGPAAAHVAGAQQEVFLAAGAEARFKVRPPIQKLRAAHGKTDRKVDVRTLARGAVCETRPREELAANAQRLRGAVARLGVEPPAHPGAPEGAVGGFARGLRAQLGYAAAFDRAAKERFPSAKDLCDTLRLHLLVLEEHARAPANGMADGLRFIYFGNERPPTISAL